jgi:hypothetical protein
VKVSAIVGCCLLAAACGYHDTPVATYHAPLPDDAGAGGSAAAGNTSGAGYGGAAVEPLCTRTYPILVPGLASRYKQGAARKIWVEAERDCESEGGHLVVIDDEAENVWLADVATNAVTNLPSSHQLVWLGLGDHETEGEFRWVTGAPLTLRLWFDDEPNSLRDIEDCGEIRATGRWNDDRCNADLTYVCECDGAASAGTWCDTDLTTSCGDCSSACLPEQTCSSQQCM